MKVKCEYCDNYISDTDDQCPFCGAPNEHMARSAAGVPKTIEELKAFALAHNLPLAKMRVFIGEDYKSPKAYGIFKRPDGICVVYKNKADGSRAVRYEGEDEAYAVNELYQKMKTEVARQKAMHPQNQKKSFEAGKRAGRRGFCSFFLIALVIIIIVGIAAVSNHKNSPSQGYYSYGGQEYYYGNDSWYVYSPYYDWMPASADEELTENYGDYYDSHYYSSSYDATDFSGSSYYGSGNSWNSDSYDSGNSWDSGFGWDSDDDWDDSDWDWDSGFDWDDSGFDWDSDW